MKHALQLCLLLTAFIWTSCAQANDSKARVAAAKAIFRVELAGRTFSRCALSSSRMLEAYPHPLSPFEHGAPADLVTKHLGRPIGKKSTAPIMLQAVSATILDPDSKYREALCNEAERASFDQTRVAALRPGERHSIESEQYSFPLFDATMQKAIIFVERKSMQVSLVGAGPGKYVEAGIYGDAHVYILRHGKWQFALKEHVFAEHLH